MLNVDEIAKFIDKKSFVDNYNALKDNIVKINPVYVIGTLRAFGFKKWTSGIKPDGGKEVKVESFTNWWKRMGNELMSAKVDPTQTLSDSIKNKNFPKVHQGENLIPEPPENLELFLKLLVDYINNNEFVLNPQDKSSVINARPITSLIPELTEEQRKDLYSQEFVQDKGGRKFRNTFYKSPMSKRDDETLSSALKLSTNIPRLRSSGFKENIYGLGLLYDFLNMMGGSNMLVGGGVEPALEKNVLEDILKNSNIDIKNNDLNKLYSELKPCSRTAIETYRNVKNVLKRRGKNLDDGLDKSLVELILKLFEAENSLSIQLNLLAKYSRILNSVSEEVAAETITMDSVTEAVQKYELLERKKDKKNNRFVELVMEILDGSEYAGFGPRYTSL